MHNSAYLERPDPTLCRVKGYARLCRARINAYVDVTIFTKRYSVYMTIFSKRYRQDTYTVRTPRSNTVDFTSLGTPVHRVVGVCGKFMVCACHRCYIETGEKNKPYVTRNGWTHVPSEVKSTVEPPQCVVYSPHALALGNE